MTGGAPRPPASGGALPAAPGEGGTCRMDTADFPDDRPSGLGLGNMAGRLGDAAAQDESTTGPLSCWEWALLERWMLDAVRARAGAWLSFCFVRVQSQGEVGRERSSRATPTAARAAPPPTPSKLFEDRRRTRPRRRLRCGARNQALALVGRVRVCHIAATLAAVILAGRGLEVDASLPKTVLAQQQRKKRAHPTFSIWWRSMAAFSASVLGRNSTKPSATTPGQSDDDDEPQQRQQDPADSHQRARQAQWPTPRSG